MIVAKVEIKNLKEIEKSISKISRKTPNAIASSLNRTMNNVITNMGKEARKKYHVKQGAVKSSSQKKKASVSSLSAEVKAIGKTIGLENFRVTPKSVDPFRDEQLKIAVKKGGMKKVMGSFIADLHGIKVTQRKTRKRLPIERLFGPSVPQMIGNDESIKFITEEAQKTYEKRLEHEISRLIDKIGG